MASDVGVGDAEVPKLMVDPFDDTTLATLTVTAPDGATTDSVPSTADGGNTWTALPVVYNAAGRWLLTWDVTGTGAGREIQEVYVVASPTAGGPTWLPGRSRVANYVPGRTLAVNANTHELTFDSSTRPTGVMVDRLIADAASRVAARVGAVDASLTDTASTVVAILAAAAVERGYPDDQDTTQALQRANDLERLAETMLTELANANQAASGQNPTSPGANLLPLYSFPTPVPWGDDLL